MEKFLFSLMIPYKMESVELLQVPIEFTASRLKFSEREIIQLQVALEEIITNSIKNNLESINKNNISVHVYDSGDGIRIKVHEFGIPFDPDNFPVYDKSALSEREETRGLGIFLIKQLVDEVEYRVLGKDGKEIDIYKKRQDNTLPEQKKDEGNFQDSPVVPKVIENFIVREVNPEETVEVAKEAYYAYGYAYLFEDIYDPKKLRELNKAGEFMSVVAITDEGEIMGHLAIIKHKFLKNVFEFGSAFVNPRFRGGGTLSKMNYKALEVAVREGAELIFVDCVTSHIFSQKAAEKFGFKATCLFLSRLEKISFNEITETGQRESLIMGFYPVKDLSHIDMNIPGKYEEIIKKIFENLGLNISSEKKENRFTEEGNQTKLNQAIDKCNVGSVYIESFGYDFRDELIKTLKKLCFKKAAVVYLYIPMNFNEIDRAIEIAENIDFFFAGIVLDNSKSHYFVMQYMNYYDVNYDMIKTNSETGTLIKEWVMRCDPNLKYIKE